MELIGVTPNSVIVELEMEEAGALAHLREEPDADDAAVRRVLDFLAAVRWLPVFWGRLAPADTAAALADAQALGWEATPTRGDLHVARWLVG